jgi:CubicO group peptidase (beta-lactamase class C family)
MKTYIIVGLLVGLSGVSVFAENGSTGPRLLARKPEVAAAIAVLDAWVTATVASREQPGLSLGVVHDQDLIWAKGYGFSDLAKKIPATPSTVYRIASISKLFTTTAVLQLRDAGKLQLDDPVAKYLPWFKIRNAHPEGPAITIRHLLTHTSGLPREAFGVNWSDLTMPKREEMIRRIGELETVFPAETEWKYSNLGLTLAGEIVASVSGEPWAQYVENYILKPLEMKATTPIPASNLPHLAVGYGRRVPGASREVEPFLDIEGERPAGSLASTVEDLARFASLQFRDGPVGGAQILKGSTLREMHRIQWLRPDWRSGWGLGFSVRRVGDQVRIGHGGSLPGHMTRLEIAPAEKLAVIVLTNANDGDPGRYVDQAFTLLTPAVVKATAVSKTPPVADPSWEKYVGVYTWKHSDVKILILNGELTMITPEADNPWESRWVLKPVGLHQFRVVPSTGYTGSGPTGDLLTFEVDGQGRAKRVGTPNFYWVRK